MDLETARWRKSSYSESTYECVEVAFVPGTVVIRDTKNRAAGTLTIPEPTWRALSQMVAEPVEC